MENTKATWRFPILGGTRNSYDVETFDDLLREMELDYLKLFGEVLCVDPAWRSKKEGEVLYPQKHVMFLLRACFQNLRIMNEAQVFSEEKGMSVMRLLDNVQEIISIAAIESRTEGRLDVSDWLQREFDSGKLKTKEDWDDLMNALSSQRDLWNDERFERWKLERELKQVKLEEQKKRILRDAPLEDRERFTQIAMKAKRTKGSKIVFSDVERRCKIIFPAGIAGRHIDDKYAKELCELWKIE